LTITTTRGKIKSHNLPYLIDKSVFVTSYLNTSQVDFLIQTYKFVAKFIKHMIFKIFGAILILVGIFLIAKYQLYLVGLILLFLGFYLAMKIGMKTL
jgi:VIT1/CCC1 family predicted Fe2+/Mn2+ transporter